MCRRAQDVIDLTDCGDVFGDDDDDDDVIDLTSHEDDALHDLYQGNVESESITSLPDGLDTENKDALSSPISTASCNGNDVQSDDLSSESSLTSTSSLYSARSVTDSSHPHDGLPGSKDTLLASENMKLPCVDSSQFRDWSDQATSNSDCESVFSEMGTQDPHITSSTPALCPAMQKDTFCQINRSLLYKLRYFKKPPVTHLFPHTRRLDKSVHPVPMPSTRVNIVNHTKDESFHQGTLYFLSEFVSASHSPPKDLVSHVINAVLLGADDQTTRHDAYMILMKIQRLHPATSESVAWEWNLLSEMMTKQVDKTCCLFLQYVVQTLDDDFHLCLQRRALHRCLCKSMLSCDKSFCNVKQVIHWIIDTVGQMPEHIANSFSQSDQERVVFLLQRMLSIAVEVDNSPTMNSNKIADYIFPYATVLKTRRQRERFFNSTENTLLRAKILEAIFQRSCPLLQTSDTSLTFGKILYFISNSSPSLESEGPEWERWDEMLHHIITLCLSLQTVITGHLRTPVIDRPDKILKSPESPLWQSEDIQNSDVNISISRFQQRTSLGAEPPAAILHRLFLLRSLLRMAVKR
ncbi:hypothetical protein GDO81_010646 [Engystomops pustulosus]|uniref:SUMO-interacting motif-containing protein 1 n=1 Tax=Engystomops pustulosus TaxID=76066 RepID=A0AAV7C1R4_ENGPU|nr:hypothetical protein GDO81_010646 [Engystomops pustulosus]